MRQFCANKKNAIRQKTSKKVNVLLRSELDYAFLNGSLMIQKSYLYNGTNEEWDWKIEVWPIRKKETKISWSLLMKFQSFISNFNLQSQSSIVWFRPKTFSNCKTSYATCMLSG